MGETTLLKTTPGRWWELNGMEWKERQEKTKVRLFIPALDHDRFIAWLLLRPLQHFNKIQHSSYVAWRSSITPVGVLVMSYFMHFARSVLQKHLQIIWISNWGFRVLRKWPREKRTFSLPWAGLTDLCFKWNVRDVTEFLSSSWMISTVMSPNCSDPSWGQYFG